jgi:hypothetical protein
VKYIPCTEAFATGRSIRVWRPVQRIDKRFGNCRRRKRPGNAAHGPAVFVDTRGSYVATEKQLVALLNTENLVVVTTADAVLVYLQRQPPALLHHDALDLIPFPLIERLIRAPWPVHFPMVLGQRRRDLLELSDDPPQSVARLAPGGRLSPLVKAVRAAKKIRRPCVITAPSTGWSCAAPRCDGRRDQGGKNSTK